LFIQTEETPNPNTLKFLPGQVLSPDGNYDFRSVAAAAISPLAGRLFEVDGVEGVFIGPNFLSVTKNNQWDWYVLKPMILGALMEHLVAKKPVIALSPAKDTATALANDTDQEEDPIVAHIKDLLDTRIRPAVAMDGGDIVFVKFDKGIVYLTLQGACSGCPSSTATLKDGIENMLKHYVPEVHEVQAV